MNQTTSFFNLIQKDIEILNNNLKKMVGAKHPILYAAAEHLFKAGGKRIRPIIVLLVAKATSQNSTILNEQRRLAEITEIIHTASLVHDDVLDDCGTRRGIKTVHSAFNTKIAVLAGDFLFAQSSWYLANLGQLEVVKIISKVITDFAEGEVRQGSARFDITISLNNYTEKSFYKTASLIAASCQGTAMLADERKEISYNLHLYGKHLGLAFQIIDDILDITSSSTVLGKPEGSDLKNGNLTASIFFCALKNKQVQKSIKREFTEPNDIFNTLEQIKNSKGIQKAKDLASEHVQTALQCLKCLDQHNKDVQGLKYLANYTLQRLY
uniref:prenyl transferase n=1 Tax=Madagascaria erythrocladioides TaxID=753684 RepID=UPI001BF14A5F|nr:prenyl transferase [Madagascaria erythrocladioides]QUE28954.1 preA [Madagascaria erythrocladioides]UNJ16505.1 prenyl transferase [Madagascaria erythrocladioides]